MVQNGTIMVTTVHHFQNSCFPTHMSNSPFKVGSFSEEKKPFYDLMIETDPKDYFQYVKHVINYLKIFNKK